MDQTVPLAKIFKFIYFIQYITWLLLAHWPLCIIDITLHLL